MLSNRASRAILSALFLLLSENAGAVTYNLVQNFFVPLPEDQVQLSLKALYSSTSTTIQSVTSIVGTSDGTIVVYDHWEDGYEPDLENPVQGSTEILTLNKGQVELLNNAVTLPRNPTQIKYDGRDYFGSSAAVSVNRAEWASSPGTVLAGASEVLPISQYGTQYVMPVGQTMGGLDNAMFEYTGMLVIASQNGTTCNFGATALPILNKGSVYQKNGGVNPGNSLVCDKPVQVHLITGDIGANYESRWYLVSPQELLAKDYYWPMGTAANGDTTYVFFYNGNSSSITVDYTTRSSAGSFAVPANGYYRYEMPVSSGAKFSSTQVFNAVATVGAKPANHRTYDWGSPLVPASALTTQVVAAWAPDSEAPATSQGKGNPLWVTASAKTTVYVDYNGNCAGAGSGCTLAPNGIPYRAPRKTPCTWDAPVKLRAFQTYRNSQDEAAFGDQKRPLCPAVEGRTD